jgi:hypothetical protein
VQQEQQWQGQLKRGGCVSTQRLHLQGWGRDSMASKMAQQATAVYSYVAGTVDLLPALLNMHLRVMILG